MYGVHIVKLLLFHLLRLNESSMSLVYNVQISGHKVDPWGIPLIIFVLKIVR